MKQFIYLILGLIIDTCDFHLKYICSYQDVSVNANSPRSLKAEAGGLKLLHGKPELNTEHVSKTNK